MVRDVGLAEERRRTPGDGLERWPEAGVPDNPGAWLMATAKNRAIDGSAAAASRPQTRGAGPGAAGRQEMAVAELEAAVDDDIGDDLLRLMFTACHPVLSMEARVALTLRCSAASPPRRSRGRSWCRGHVAQRIVRAKRTLAEARVPFEVPRGAELATRLSSVLGCSTSFQRGVLGDGRRRLDAAGSARCAATGPHPGRAHAGGTGGPRPGPLMEIQASRARARVGPAGEPVLLLDQDRGRWITFSYAAAWPRWSVPRRGPARRTVHAPGRHRACHARARTARRRTGPHRRALRGASRAAPSPVVELNRAVAVAMASGPAAVSSWSMP